MTATTAPQPPTESRPTGAPGAGKGLKVGALGLLGSVVLGVAATAPAYSLTAALGLISQEVGAKAPIVMLLGFVPILFVSFAYRALNSRMPDCGTTFSWTATIFGPHAGWMCGWAVVTAQIIVLGNLARIVGTYALLLVGLDAQAASPGWVALAPGRCGWP